MGVIDLFGDVASSSLSATVVAGRHGLKLTAFVTVPAGSSANAMAQELYTDATRELIKQTTEDVLSSDGGRVLLGRVGVQTVAINPEHFSPLQPTTTATTTRTTLTSTNTVTDTSTSTQRHLDVTTPVLTTTMGEATGTTIDGHKGAAAPIPGCGAFLLLAVLVVAAREL